MIFFKNIKCEECNGEYKIQWDDDNFIEPTKCAMCGADDPEITESGFLA
jgi:Zn ribbon nucleic-acid-binding protein